MFTKKNQEPDDLQRNIDKLLIEMLRVSCNTPEYAKMVDQLTKLTELKKTTSKTRVSPDVLVTVAANLAGIVAILGYERAHVVASKALGFVMKLR